MQISALVMSDSRSKSCWRWQGNFCGLSAGSDQFLLLLQGLCFEEGELPLVWHHQGEELCHAGAGDGGQQPQQVNTVAYFEALEAVVFPWTNETLGNKQFARQYDSAPCHTFRNSQWWFGSLFCDFATMMFGLQTRPASILLVFWCGAQSREMPTGWSATQRNCWLVASRPPLPVSPGILWG